MARTTKVGLDVDEKPFVAGMGRAAGAAEKLEDALDDVTGSAKDTAAATARAKDSTDDLGESARGAGRGINSLRDDAAKLDRKIDESARSVRDLARAIAATSDEAERAKLTEKLTIEQGNLRQRTSLRKLIDFTDMGDVKEEGVRVGARFAEGLASGLARAGGPISTALSSVFGGLPPQAQAAIGAGVVGAVAAAAPGIAAVLSGAVVGAAGAGGIIGGIAIAAKHPEVQAAARLTGDTLTQELQRAAGSFVPATVESLGIVRSEIGEIGDDLKRAFSAAAPMLAPLTRDVLAGAEDAVEGFATAVERAGPVVDVLGDIARDAGDLIGDTFEQLSENAYEGSRALAALWGVFSAGVSLLVGTVAGLTETYGLMEKFGALLIGDRDKLVQLIVEEHNAKQASGGLSTGMQGLLNAVQGFGGGAANATEEVRTLGQAIDEAAGKAIDSERANIRLEEAIDRAAEAAKKNGDGIDANIPKQRANRDALVGIASAAKEAAAKILAEGGSQDAATAATERGRAKFLATAKAMNVKEAAAIALANKLFGIPNVDRTVSVQTAKAQAAIAAVQAGLGKINSKNITVGVYYKTNGDLKLPGGTSLKNRWGGIYEHAADGLVNLREAAVYSPQGPARYAFAEPATGGEAFIPRYGDRDRSLGILQQAAQWYGASVAPAGGGGGGGMAAPEVRVFIGDQELRGMVRVEVSEHNRGLRRRVGAGAGR